MPSWGLRSPCTKGWKELYWTKRRQCLWRSSWACSQCSRLLHVVLCRSNVQHVVAADQNLGDNEVIRSWVSPNTLEVSEASLFSIASGDLSCELFTSPRLPVQEPSMYSSVLASCKFMYPSDETKKPYGRVSRYCTNKKTLWKENTRAFQHVSYLVLMAPLQLDHDCLASESIEEGLGVHGHGSHPEFGLALWNWLSSGQWVLL